MRPKSGASSPQSIRIKVDFPQPFLPTNATFRRGFSSKLIESKMGLVPYALLICDPRIDTPTQELTPT